MSTQTAAAKPGQYLTFSLKSQIYGVPIASVREINRMSEITPVPKTPTFMAGVMNLRGKVIPVVNLRLKFGIEFAEATRETCVIVIDSGEMPVGMIVDSVCSVVELRSDQIEPSPSMGTDVDTSYIVGMGKVDEKLVILVDIVSALSKDMLLTQNLTSAAA